MNTAGITNHSFLNKPTGAVQHILAVLLLYLICIDKVAGQPLPAVVKTTRILFIVDASGSMLELWEGKPRMDVAKEVLSKMVDSLKAVPNLEIALRIYGHQYDKRYSNCKDTKLEVPFKKANHDQVKAKIKSIRPQGTTLISYSLEQSGNDFPEDKNSRNVIILITDGIEACGGDPCALSLALQKKRIFLKPFIIGIGADETFAKAFKCMGQYFDAAHTKTFPQILNTVLEQTLQETTVKVHLLDIQGRPTETNVNMTFVNSFTNLPEYNFVHYLDGQGKADYLKLDAIPDYDIVVNTIPKVVKQNVPLTAGKENIISISAPQGTLVVEGNLKEYKNLSVLVRLRDRPEIIHVQSAAVKERYLVGEYDVEVLTVPRKIFSGVKIKQSTLTTLEIDTPGILNISESIAGFGSLYLVNRDGQQVWILNLEKQNSKTSLSMQPGNYRLVFRPQKSQGSAYTFVHSFEIASGASTNLKLF